MALSEWTSRKAPGGIVLTGDRVVLEPLDMTIHADGLFIALSDKELWTYLPFTGFQDADDFAVGFGEKARSNDWITYVIRRASDESLVGMASYMRLRPEHGSVEVGCVAFGEALKRTPEATEAMYLMARHVFEDLGYRRYEWKCDANNAPSRKAALRLGFQFEGIFRQDMVSKGKNRDTAWFSMLDHEWPAIGSAIQTWLADNNFDHTGHQKVSLTKIRERGG